MKKKQIDNIYIKIDLGMFAFSATLTQKFSLITKNKLTNETKTYID